MGFSDTYLRSLRVGVFARVKATCQLCHRSVKDFSIREDLFAQATIMKARCHGREQQYAFEREFLFDAGVVDAVIEAIQWFGEDARRLGDSESTRIRLDDVSRNKKSAEVASWPSGKRLIQLDD